VLRKAIAFPLWKAIDYFRNNKVDSRGSPVVNVACLPISWTSSTAQWLQITPDSINNAEIRVTLSWITLQGHFTELVVILKHKKMKCSHRQFEKACLQAAQERQKWWRIPDGWWKTVPSTCSCHGKRTVAEHRSSGGPNHWRLLTSLRSCHEHNCSKVWTTLVVNRSQWKGWYWFHSPMEGDRLSWHRYCSKGAQPMHKAAYHSDFYDNIEMQCGFNPGTSLCSQTDNGMLTTKQKPPNSKQPLVAVHY